MKYSISEIERDVRKTHDQIVFKVLKSSKIEPSEYIGAE
ncbi:uncharacterized protein METZ01_LOCUS150620 [marine metagenome]|uniref:Uncharacterized protein n=1 Tax=marine metagenome TaxID=408172 RepID=A0A382A893_9ZZZZ